MKLHYALLVFMIACVPGVRVTAQTDLRRTSLAVLDFGDTEFARRVADRLSAALSSDRGLRMVDRSASRAAARGVGYAGSLNLTLAEARDLGGALGCDFYVTGDAQTLRRSPSVGPVFYEAYASTFLVSARTGRLILWDRPHFEAPSAEAAEKLLLAETDKRAPRYAAALHTAQQSERGERALALQRQAPVIYQLAEDDTGTAQEGRLRPPAPYRRLRPGYTEAAARAEAEATIDVLVDIGADGEVTRTEVTRWAGFGLDEATVGTVRQLHFRPAMRDGNPVPVRVLLRYNFRDPAKEGKRQK